ncbi:MAG: response regulator, partial [Acidimicrobiales bacterium]|nr:response regulator [Acidimicrobiales bacterium]
LHHHAWATAPAEGYAVVLIEQALGGMDGVRLARILRTHEATRDSVVLLLNSNMDLSRAEAREAGIESVLIKPVRTSYLLRRLVDALVTQPAHDPAGPGRHRKEPRHAPSPAR